MFVPAGRADDDRDPTAASAVTFAGTAAAVEKSTATSAGCEASSGTALVTRPTILHAGFARQLLDQPTHAAVSDEQDAKRLVAHRAASTDEKNSSCRRDIASGRSRSLSTTVRFRRDAACDTIRRQSIEPRDQPHRQVRLARQVVTDGAEDRHALIDIYVREAAQVPRDGLQPPVVVQGHRHADLRRRHDVNRSGVVLEDLEHPPQKSVREQHARRGDVDNADVSLAGKSGHRACWPVPPA